MGAIVRLKPTILFVDDETSLLNAIEGMFQFQDEFAIDLAASGEEALRLMQKKAQEGAPYHIIVTDQLMPSMTGEELLERVKDEFPDTIRLILTAYGTLDLAQKAMNELGVFGFLQKPITRTQLLRILEKAAERYQENQRIKQLRLRYEQEIPPSELLENLWIIIAKQEEHRNPEVIATYPRDLPGIDAHRIAVQTFLGSAALVAVFGQESDRAPLQMTFPFHYLKMEARIHFDRLKAAEGKFDERFAILVLAPAMQDRLAGVASSCMLDFAKKYREMQDTALDSLFQCIQQQFEVLE
jgi:FixJ family two-component response regulator